MKCDFQGNGALALCDESEFSLPSTPKDKRKPSIYYLNNLFKNKILFYSLIAIWSKSLQE